MTQAAKSIYKSEHLKVQKIGDVYLMWMSKKQNILDSKFMDELSDALDYLEKNTEGPGCLLTLSTNPRTYCAGLDLKTLLKSRHNLNEAAPYLQKFGDLAAKFLEFPMITIAVLNGHTYAAGLFLALCHDFRIMNKDFGNLCVSEIKFGMSIPPGMNAICVKKIPIKHYRKMALTGEPVSSKEGHQIGIVDELQPKDKLVQRAIEMGQEYAQYANNRETLKGIKFQMCKDVLNVMYNEGVDPRFKDIKKPRPKL